MAEGGLRARIAPDPVLRDRITVDSPDDEDQRQDVAW